MFKKHTKNKVLVKQNMLIKIYFIIMLLPLNISMATTINETEIKREKIEVSLNKSKLITLNQEIVGITQGNPGIADSSIASGAVETGIIGKNQIIIKGKSLGTTNIYLIGKNKETFKQLEIEVTHDLSILKTKLHQLLPNENIAVHTSQKNIVLSGEISYLPNMQAAINLAESFLGSSNVLGNETSKPNSNGMNITTNTNSTVKVDPSNSAVPHVINLMSIGGAQQVMLDVKVAEIDRTVIKGLNVNFSAIQNSNNFLIGAVNGGGSLNAAGLGGALKQHNFNAAALFLQAISGEFLFNVTVDAANEQQLAKILAQPTLTTLSGQPATFISGGEFPIPVPNNFNGITIQFKEYGVSLKFVPVVLDSGRINLNMHVSVSELTSNAAINAKVNGTNSDLVVPSLTKREASSTLELGNGQTMVIAGLISDKVQENINKFPGLGDIPGFGMLFRNSQYKNDQVEMVIIVTPRIAKPILAKNIQLPTDSFVKPDDVDFYILGRTESRNSKTNYKTKTTGSNSAIDTKGGLDGEYGQQLIKGD
jgi:pilus assembly protein CpaC